MKILIKVSALNVLVLATGLAGLKAEAAGGQSSGVLIAVIDINNVFKNHVRFNQQMESIKNEVSIFESELLKDRQQITSQQEKLGSYKSGSLEYKKIEEKMARLVSDLRVRAELKRKDILQREAKVYFETYQEVASQVEAFSEQHNIGMVLRFDSAPIDPSKRSSVLKGVNRAVVYQRNINITIDILDRLNQGANRTSLNRPGRPVKPR